MSRTYFNAEVAISTAKGLIKDGHNARFAFTLGDRKYRAFCSNNKYDSFNGDMELLIATLPTDGKHPSYLTIHDDGRAFCGPFYLGEARRFTLLD